MARVHRSIPATGLTLLLVAGCSLMPTADPPLPELVNVEIEVENHSTDEWSLLYFQDLEGMPLEVAQTHSLPIAPCEAFVAEVVTLHTPFAVFAVEGSPEDYRSVRTVPQMGGTPVLHSDNLPLGGASQRYQLVINADGSQGMAPAEQALPSADLC